MRITLIFLVAVIASSCLTASSPPLPQPALPRPTLPQSSISQQEVVPTKSSALTPGMVKTKLIAGKTTQAEVMEVFGPPDHVTRSGRGEMWGYDKVSREVAEVATGARADASAGASAGGDVSLGAGIVPFIGGLGGGVVGGALGGIGGGVGSNVGQSTGQSTGQSAQQAQRVESTKTVFLLIYFSDESIVTDYKLSATKF